MKPPSPSQMRVLTEMSKGNVLHRCVHSTLSDGVSYFLSKQMESVREPTVSALLRLGLIADCSDPKMRWSGSQYAVTPAGWIAIQARNTEAKRA